jgi:hypothetical protein
MALREKNVLRQAETGSEQRSPISESIDDGLPAAPGHPTALRGLLYQRARAQEGAEARQRGDQNEGRGGLGHRGD